MAMTAQFFDMTSSTIFFEVVLYLLSTLVTYRSFMSISSLVQELGQFLFKGIDQKSRNWKYSCLSFAQYMETGLSKEYQTWHKFF